MNITERVIIKALIEDMRAHGYEVAGVWDGEEYVLPNPDAIDGAFQYAPNDESTPTDITRAMTTDEALQAIDTVDDCTLHFTHQNKKTWGDRGVFLVLGNGEDVISDHHDPRGEPFSEVIADLGDKIEKQQLG